MNISQNEARGLMISLMMLFVVDDDNRPQFSDSTIDNLGDYLKQSVRLRMGLSTCCGLSAAVGCESFV